jgi:hypothetical protein
VAAAVNVCSNILPSATLQLSVPFPHFTLLGRSKGRLYSPLFVDSFKLKWFDKWNCVVVTENFTNEKGYYLLPFPVLASFILFPQAVRWHIQTAPLGVAILAL